MKDWIKEHKIWSIIISLLVLSFVFVYFSSGDSKQTDLTGTRETIQDIKGQITQKEITYYIDPLPYGVDRQYINSVREGISYWEKRENVIFKESSSLNVDVLVQWVKEFGGEHLGYAYNKEFIEIGLGDSLCLGKWQPYKYESVLIIATHEFGHIIGKEHTNDPQNIMYIPLKTKYEVDVEETEVLPDGWYRFYPTCTREDVSEYLFEVTSDKSLNVYIVPSIEEFNKLEAGEEFNHYIECSKEKITHYKDSCVIGSGAGIILENPTLFGLGSPAQFTITIKEI